VNATPAIVGYFAGSTMIPLCPWFSPPSPATGVDGLHKAWALCPANCIPLVLEDLNVNFEHPWDAQEGQISNLLDGINLVDTS
jgi:hypothetical protein